MTTHTPQKKALPDSTFHMLRCVTVMVHADDIVNREERQFLQTLLQYFGGKYDISDAQKVQLMQDLQTAPDLDQLLPHVTDHEDLENLVLFSGMLAKADGEMHPAEEAVLRKIRAHKDTAVRPVAAALPAQIVNAPPVVDMDLLANEVREIVRQEFYRQGIQKSGIVHKSSALSVADAFVERGSLVHANVAETLMDRKKPSVSTRRTLMHQEKVLARARFHYAYTLKALLISAAAFWLTHLAMPWIYQGVFQVQQALRLPETLVNADFWTAAFRWDSWIVAGALLGWWMLRWWATEIILTDRRLLYKHGILFVKYTKIDLRQLFESVVQQSRLGAMLNYGSVFIYSNMVDTSLKGDKFDRNIVLPEIADPHRFASTIDRAKRMLRATGD